MFKRSPSLTDQTTAHIRERIINNEFEDGKIPPEMELAQTLGVSRTTIREALSRLETEGAIFRRQGAGTFVNEPGLQIKSRLDEIWSYEDVLRAHGYTPSIRVLAVREEHAGPQVAQQLDLQPTDTLLVMSKLFMEDDMPVILTYNYIPQRFLLQPYDDATCALPIYEFLETCCQQSLAYYLSEIVPVLATGEVGALLRRKAHTALIAFEEIGYNPSHEPILRSRSYFRDDLLRFRLIRRRVF